MITAGSQDGSHPDGRLARTSNEDKRQGTLMDDSLHCYLPWVGRSQIRQSTASSASGSFGPASMPNLNTLRCSAW